MAVPMKVGHVGKQPTSLNGELESVSQISMVTQITPGFSQKRHSTSKSMGLTLSLLWARKMAHGTRRAGIGLIIFSPLGLENQSRHIK